MKNVIQEYGTMLIAIVGTTLLLIVLQLSFWAEDGLLGRLMDLYFNAAC